MAEVDRTDLRRPHEKPASGDAGRRRAQEYTELSDVELLELVREGETSAFAPLWVRHADSARRVAARISSTVDPDDLLAEAYTRIFAAARTGNGPRTTFLPYLYATMRNISQNAGRRQDGDIPLPDAEGPDTTTPTTDELLDRSILREAFANLSPQWRTVLWLTEIEGMSARDVAAATGQTPNAVAAQTYRAREALKTAWLTAHVRGPYPTDRCPWAVEHLAQDRPLRPRVRRQLENHLATCDHCALVAEEFAVLRSRLRGPLLPLLLGPTASGPGPLGWPGRPAETGLSLDLDAGGMLPASSAGVASGLAAAAAAAATALLIAGVAVDVLAPGPAAGAQEIVAAPPAPPPTSSAGPAPVPETEPGPVPRPSPAPPTPGPAPAPGTPPASPGTPPASPADLPEVVTGSGPTRDAVDVPRPVVVPRPEPQRPVEPEEPQEPGQDPGDDPDENPGDPGEDPGDPGDPGEDPETPFEAVLADAGGMLLPEVSGTAEPGTVVEVLVDGEVLGVVTADEDGAWRHAVDAAPGVHALAVRPAGAPDETAELGTVELLAPTLRTVQHEGTLQPILVVGWDRGDEGLVAVATVDDVPTGRQHALGPQTAHLQLPPPEAPVEAERVVVVTMRYLDAATGRQGAALVVPVVVGPEQPPRVTDTPL